jgi:hypothetical protein
VCSSDLKHPTGYALRADRKSERSDAEQSVAGGML